MRGCASHSTAPKVIRKFLENNCGDFIDTEDPSNSRLWQHKPPRVIEQTCLFRNPDRQEQFAVDYGDSRMSIADSFVAGAYDATSYFRGPKDPLRPRSFSQGLKSSWEFVGDMTIRRA